MSRNWSKTSPKRNKLTKKRSRRLRKGIKRNLRLLLTKRRRRSCQCSKRDHRMRSKNKKAKMWLKLMRSKRMYQKSKIKFRKWKLKPNKLPRRVAWLTFFKSCRLVNKLPLRRSNQQFWRHKRNKSTLKNVNQIRRWLKIQIKRLISRKRRNQLSLSHPKPVKFLRFLRRQKMINLR